MQLSEAMLSLIAPSIGRATGVILIWGHSNKTQLELAGGGHVLEQDFSRILYSKYRV